MADGAEPNAAADGGDRVCSEESRPLSAAAAELPRSAVPYMVSRHSATLRESAEFPTSVKDVGSWANGMKLASECILDQLLTQFLPGFNHERETLGSPLLDARLHPMGAFRINNQRHE
jgi:hypothetical protein